MTEPTHTLETDVLVKAPEGRSMGQASRYGARCYCASMVQRYDA